MLELDEIVRAVPAARVVSLGATRFRALANDSRNLRGGELFVALRTATGDGHAHVGEALSRGASGLLVEDPRAVSSAGRERESLTVVSVPSTRDAIADWVRERLDGATQVAIAGTLGKSTMQSCLRAAWAAAAEGPVTGTGDGNDSLGIPIFLSATPPRPERVVVEVAASDRAEERRLGSMLQPRVLCVTSVADAEALYWGSAQELGEGLRTMWPEVGTLVLPAALEGRMQAPATGQRLTFGPAGSGAAVEWWEMGGGPWPRRWRCGLRWPAGGAEIDTTVHPEVGGPALAATAAALLGLGLDPRIGLTGLGEWTAPPGRLRLLKGRVAGTILDDTVDSTPGSLGVALRALEALPRPHLCLLGPVRGELGVPAVEAIAGDGASVLSIPSVPGSGTPGRESELLAAAADVLRRGGSVLVKASSLARAERLVRQLASDGSALLRQEPARDLVPFRSPRRPTWVELDLGALRDNVAEVVRELDGVALMAVVKADAYGHGALTVGRNAIEAGAAWLAVATVAEGAELRAAGIDAPCLVLGYTPPAQVELAVRLGLAVTVFDREVVDALARAGRRTGRRSLGHIKIDTGMTRLGVRPNEVAELLARAEDAVDMEGIYTHFRSGENAAVRRDQLRRLEQALEVARAAGHSFRIRHAASSSAWHRDATARLDMVRVGGELLGLRTADGRRRRPVLSFKTTIAQVHEVEAGTWVGYGEHYRTPRPTRIATIPVGYGDGFRRGPRNWGSVLIRGDEHPLVGDVCMDLAMVDVGSDPRVARGDEVVLIGRQRGSELSAEVVAERLGILNYELVAQILPRVPREERSGL